MCEIKTTRLEKLLTNFPNEDMGLNQYEAFKKEGDEELNVSILMTILDSTHPIHFYKMKVKEKLEHVKALKATATRFFKASNYKKAADLY